MLIYLQKALTFQDTFKYLSTTHTIFVIKMYCVVANTYFIKYI